MKYVLKSTVSPTNKKTFDSLSLARQFVRDKITGNGTILNDDVSRNGRVYTTTVRFSPVSVETFVIFAR